LEIVERYIELLKTAKVHGFLFEQQNYVPKPEWEWKYWFSRDDSQSRE